MAHNAKWKETIRTRLAKDQAKFLEHVRRMPVVEVACGKAGIGHSTYYRWRENPTFREAADKAIAEGEELINDMGESQLIAMIKEKNFSAVQLWLRTHHPKYGNKLEVTARLESDELTSEQEALVKEALGKAAPRNKKIKSDGKAQPQRGRR